MLVIMCLYVYVCIQLKNPGYTVVKCKTKCKTKFESVSYIMIKLLNAFTIYIRPTSCVTTGTISRNKYLPNKVLFTKVTILVYSINKLD